jgi:hypothetical protein
VKPKSDNLYSQTNNQTMLAMLAHSNREW